MTTPVSVEEVFRRFVAVEYGYFTPRGEPLCWPVTPYWNPDAGAVAISTGLAYPDKALYARANPKVAVLASDPTGSGLEASEPVLVQGEAVVLDEDLQANTERYIAEVRRKFPSARLAINPLTVRFLDFYLPRLWVEIPTARVQVGPRELVRDPAPAKRVPRLDEREKGALASVVRSLGEGVVAIADEHGYPYLERMQILSTEHGSVELERSLPEGPAALSLHRHTFGGTRFKAWMARGWIAHHGGTVMFHPHRLVGFFGNGAVFPLSVIPNVAALRTRLKRELAARGATMPILRLPR